MQVADRGIGGTGIVGVITGFASVCLGGREVTFDPDLPVMVDEMPAFPADLRAGQLAAIEAANAGSGLRARRISVRHEASGPVESVEANGIVHVAGQRVHMTDQTWGGGLPQVGEWLAVSGLRGADDTIEATRVDRRAPGMVLVHGVLLREGETMRVGALEIRPVDTHRLLPGQAVTVSGRYADGVLYASTLTPDVLAENPVAYFGPSVGAFVLEGYVSDAGGRLRLGRWTANSISAFGPVMPGRAVVEFARGGNGALRTMSIHMPPAAPNGPVRPISGASGGGAFRPPPMEPRHLMPAPLPNRSMNAPTGQGFGTGQDPARRGASGYGRRSVGGDSDHTGPRGPQDGGQQGH